MRRVPVYVFQLLRVVRLMWHHTLPAHMHTFRSLCFPLEKQPILSEKVFRRPCFWQPPHFPLVPPRLLTAVESLSFDTEGSRGRQTTGAAVDVARRVPLDDVIDLFGHGELIGDASPSYEVLDNAGAKR